MSPQYDNLRVLGCSCYPNLRDFPKPKVIFDQLNAHFIGYSLNHKG